MLTKLTRNADRDRGDVEYLATAVPLDVSVLRQRYQREMRPYVGIPEREDLTLDLWIEIIQEAQRAPPTSKAANSEQEAMAAARTAVAKRIALHRLIRTGTAFSLSRHLRLRTARMLLANRPEPPSRQGSP